MLSRTWPALTVGIALALLSACADPAPPWPTPAGVRPTPDGRPIPTAGRPLPTPILPDGPTPSPAAGSTPSPPATGSPQPTAAIAIEWLSGDGASEFSPFDLISDATSAGGTLVAVGAYEDDRGDSGAAAWYSADGMLWRRAADIPGAADGVMEDVSLGPAGLLAVGYGLPGGRDVEPRAWLSSDGLVWQHIGDRDLERGQMSAVAANSLGYVALGFDPVTEEGLAWTSRDGRDWSAALPVPSFEVQPSVNDVVALGNGFLAYGSTGRDERAAMWTSRDGRQWQPVAGFPASPSSSVNAVTASGTRLVAVGASYLDSGTLAVAWTSSDGMEWQRVLDEETGERGEMRDVVPVGTGFLAVGAAGGERREELRAVVWSSADGQAWLREPDQPIFELARMAEVIRAGPGLVALGERADDLAMEVFTPAVWLGVAR